MTLVEGEGVIFLSLLPGVGGDVLLPIGEQFGGDGAMMSTTLKAVGE